MKKFLIVLFSAVLVFYLLLAAAVRPLVLKAVELAMREDEKHKVQISELKFRNAYLSSLRSVTVSGISVKFRFLSGDEFLEHREFNISLNKAVFALRNLKQRKFGLQLSGLSVRTVEDNEDRNKLEYVEGQNLEIKFVLDFLHPETISEQMKNWSKGMGDLLLKGKTNWPVEFSGATYISFHDKPIPVRMSVQKRGDEYALIIYEKDIKDMAAKMNEQITNAEINLITKYPLRAPALLKLSDYAFRAAQEAHLKQSDVSENTYRHVVWSYRLTRQYGEVFAKEVTDAHEATDLEGDRDIDLRNNAVGRSYAKEGIPESSILNRLLTDPGAVLDESEWPKMKYRTLAEPHKRTVPES